MLFVETLAQSHALRAAEAAASQPMAEFDRYIVKHVGDDLSLDDLAQAVGVSKFALTRLFHKRYGVAPMRWMWSFRAHLAKDVIGMGLDLPLMDVLTLCGFNSPQHFSRFFRKTFRQAPSQLMKELHATIHVERDVQKARQELYERFESIVTESLQRYIASYQMPLDSSGIEVMQPSHV
jgi:transcriptional regulator GlxA family with amidase domain